MRAKKSYRLKLIGRWTSKAYRALLQVVSDHGTASFVADLVVAVALRQLLVTLGEPPAIATVWAGLSVSIAHQLKYRGASVPLFVAFWLLRGAVALADSVRHNPQVLSPPSLNADQAAVTRAGLLFGITFLIEVLAHLPRRIHSNTHFIEPKDTLPIPLGAGGQRWIQIGHAVRGTNADLHAVVLKDGLRFERNLLIQGKAKFRVLLPPGIFVLTIQNPTTSSVSLFIDIVER